MDARKVIIKVAGEFQKDGQFRPKSITWEDGKSYEVDRLKQVARRAATKVGGTGLRYTVMIAGKERYLFREDDIWFVEAHC